MIKIKERKKVKLFIPSLNKEYELSKPTFGEQEKYQEQLSNIKDEKGTSMGPMIDFLASMGIPKDDVLKLDIDEYTEIIEYVVGSKKNLAQETSSSQS